MVDYYGPMAQGKSLTKSSIGKWVSRKDYEELAEAYEGLKSEIQRLLAANKGPWVARDTYESVVSAYKSLEEELRCLRTTEEPMPYRFLDLTPQVHNIGPDNWGVSVGTAGSDEKFPGWSLSLEWYKDRDAAVEHWNRLINEITLWVERAS